MSQLPPEAQLTRLANAHQLSRAVHVAADLRLGHHLRDGDRTAADLAADLEVDSTMLERLLRFLAEIGVVAEDENGRFGPTPLSDRLDLVDNIAQGEESWQVWGALPQALRSGQPAFADVHGKPFYDYAVSHPRRRQNWITWNRQVAESLAPMVAEALKLDGDEIVVDVGGGDGSFLAAILAHYPGCRGVLCDLPEVVRDAGQVLDAAGVTDRCEIVPGDARHSVPAGGDVYLMSRVLMNWSDEGAVELLSRCREAMAPHSMIQVVEVLMPTAGEPGRRALAASDLHLFLLWGGGHRTREQMAELFDRAGLTIRDVRGLSGAAGPNISGWMVVEGNAKD